MSDAMNHTAHPRGFLSRLIVRLYTLILIGVVLVCTYMAFAYLVQILFFPQLTPPDYVNRPMEIDPESLHAGVQPDIRPEIDTAPIDHYHGLGYARFTRPLSGCTVSGCHSPLPHTAHKESRAFANLHSSFIDCAVCHHAEAPSPMPATWVDPLTGEPRDTPALLQLGGLFAQEEDFDVKAEMIRSLLDEAVRESGHDESLVYLRTQLYTTVPNSPVFRQAMENLRAELANHDRGEYAAVIAPLPVDAFTTIGDRDLINLARRRQSAPPDKPEHQRLYDAIHDKVLAKPDTCLGCHNAENPRIDLAALGYPPHRVEQLQSLAIARIIQSVREGVPFHLPNVLEDGRSD